MGSSKVASFNKQQNLIAGWAKALAHPARIAILEVIISKKSCICGEIVNELPLAQSTISQHLKELKLVGILKGVIEGSNTCYCIDENVWHELSNQFSVFFSNLQFVSCQNRNIDERETQS